MNIINDSINAPRRFIIGSDVYGQFYDSRIRKCHIGFYIPYTRPPRDMLCGSTRVGAEWPGSRENDPHMCPDCWSKMLQLAMKYNFEQLEKLINESKRASS